MGIDGADTPSGAQNLALHLPDRFLSATYLRRLQSQFVAMRRHQMGGLGMGAVGRGGAGGAEAAGVGEAGSAARGERVAEAFVGWLGDVFEREG